MTNDRDRSTDALEADLRAFAHRAAPEPPPQLLDEVLRTTQTLPQRARWSLASWPGLAAVAAIVVLAIAIGVGTGLPQRIGLLVSSPTAGPHASGSSVIPSDRTPAPDGSPSVSPSQSIAPSAAPATVYRKWVAAPIPDPQQVFGGEAPQAVVAFKGAFFAVGGVNAGCCTAAFVPDTRAVVWRSADGRSWQLKPDLSVFAQGHMSDVAANANRMVAVGSAEVESKQYPGEGEPHGAVWTSDDGVTWTIVTGTPIFTEIITVQDGFLAVSPGQAGPSIWSSSNGRSWHRVADPTELGSGSITVIRTTSVGLVAVGLGDGSSTEAPPGGVIWVSGDGTEWQRIDATDTLRDLEISDVTELRSSILAIGQDKTTGMPVVLGSANGLDWRRLSTPALETQAILLSKVVGTPAGFVAFDSGEGAGAVWVSSDGERWDRATGEEASFDGMVTDAIVSDHGLLVAVGAGDSPNSHGVPRAWYAMP